MTTYRVTDLFTLAEVKPGDTVNDFRGDPAKFLSVTRGTEYNGTAKVEVELPDGFKQEYYANVFHLRVETFVRCPHCGKDDVAIDSDGYLVKHNRENRPCDGWGMLANMAVATSERLQAAAGTGTPATAERASTDEGGAEAAYFRSYGGHLPDGGD